MHVPSCVRGSAAAAVVSNIVKEKPVPVGTRRVVHNVLPLGEHLLSSSSLFFILVNICLVPYFRSLRIVRNIHIDHNASFLFCGAHDRGRGVGTGPGCTKCRIVRPLFVAMVTFDMDPLSCPVVAGYSKG